MFSMHEIICQVCLCVFLCLFYVFVEIPVQYIVRIAQQDLLQCTSIYLMPYVVSILLPFRGDQHIRVCSYWQDQTSRTCLCFKREIQTIVFQLVRSSNKLLCTTIFMVEVGWGRISPLHLGNDWINCIVKYLKALFMFTQVAVDV